MSAVDEVGRVWGAHPKPSRGLLFGRVGEPVAALGAHPGGCAALWGVGLRREVRAELCRDHK